jgi:hypothetical protein
MQYLSTAGGHVNILGITEAVQDENAVRCVVQRFLNGLLREKVTPHQLNHRLLCYVA